MKETFRLWKTIFSRPAEGYAKITPQTRLGAPLGAVLIVFLVSGFLLIPVVTSDAYRQAAVRANLDAMEKSGLLTDPATRRAATEQLSSPLTRSAQLMGAVAGPAANFLAASVPSASLLWLAGLALKSRIRFGVALRVFVFSSAVLAWQALLTSVVVLLSDYAGVLARVNTMAAFRYALSVPFSLSILFPPGSVAPVFLVAVDFVTNIFNIIFYCLLAIGVRAQSEHPATWKAVVAAGAIALFHFLLTSLPAFFA